MFVDRDSGAQEDSFPESTRRTLRYDARDGGHAVDVPAEGYAPIPRARAPEPESAPAEATQPAVRLDGDWIQTMDTASGDLYYCNLRTGESSWEPPPKVPPPTPQETASLLAMPVAMPRSAAPARFVNPDSNSTPPATPPRDVVPKRFGKPRDALPSATRPWERFSKRASLAAKGGASFRGASRYAAEAVEAVTKTVLDVAPDVVPGVAAAAQKKTETARAWRAARCKRTGRRYFYEPATRRTSWTVLSESSDEDAPPPPPLESVSNAGMAGDGIGRRASETSSADASLVLRPTARPPASPTFARSRNAPGSSPTGIARGTRALFVSPKTREHKPAWDSKSPEDATREEAARARGAALRAARAEAPRVSSVPSATTLSPRRAAAEGTAAPSPATLAKMEVLKRRSSSAHERRLAYGEQVRARTFAETNIAVATESRRVAETTSVSPLTSTLSRKTSLVSSSPSSPTAFPSPSSRVSERRPTPARRASSRRSMSLRGQPSEPGKEKAEERHNPFAAAAAEERAATTLQARARGFLARKRAREIRARAATKSGAEVPRCPRTNATNATNADERARAEPSAVSSAKLEAERSRESVPPGLMIKESVNDRADRTSRLDENKAESERRDATRRLSARNASFPEPEPVVFALDSERVQDARLPFEAYAATHFTKPYVSDPSGKKRDDRGCFGFCRSAEARRRPRADDPSAAASHASSPIRVALTAAAEALGASSAAAALFRALLDHAGDDRSSSRTKKARAQTEATKQTNPSSLFFTRPFSKDAEPFSRKRLLDALARDDAFGAAMRDEWYCQVLKQTSNHPNAERELRVWRLVYLAACAFAPSEALAPYVLARCRDAAAGKAAANADTKSPSFRDGGADSKISNSGGKTSIERRNDHDAFGDAANRQLAVVAELTRARLAAALAQGASLGVLGDETRARAADRAFLDIDAIPAFGATLEELACLEARADTSPESASPTPFVPRALLALLRTVERNGAARGLFRGAPEDAAAAAALARAATRARGLEAAADRATPGVAAELVKLVLRGLALPVIPVNMHAACLASEASPQGVVRALAPLPAAHRAALAATTRAAAAAAADAFGAPASGEAARAAEAIAAELAPCLMFPAAGTGEDEAADEASGRAAFVTRLIRVMLMHASAAESASAKA